MPGRPEQDGLPASGLISDLMRGALVSTNEDERELFRLAADPLALNDFLKRDQDAQPSLPVVLRGTGCPISAFRQGPELQPATFFLSPRVDGTSMEPEPFKPSGDDYTSAIPGVSAPTLPGGTSHHMRLAGLILPGIILLVSIALGCGLASMW